MTEQHKHDRTPNVPATGNSDKRNKNDGGLGVEFVRNNKEPGNGKKQENK
ncbi:hypothetical protein DET47_104256 [Shewanella putrefaciens]|nr:hypothetical protein DET47_104256 [Shewanella putrefaciens]